MTKTTDAGKAILWNKMKRVALGEYKMRRDRKRHFALIVGMSVLLAAGCSPQNGKQPEETAAPAVSKPQPVSGHLSLYMDLGLSDDWIQKFIVGPVRKKFPDLTLDIVRKQKGSNPDELVAAGTFPDILYNSTPRLSPYRDLNLLYDMRDLIKKYNFPVSGLNQEALDAVKQWGRNGEIYGLPFWVNFSVLYYNKDIFDKFGVDYPKDGMTWDEAIELSKRLTRTDSGVAYRGLDIHDMNSFYSQLSQPYVDPNTDKALLESDGFKRIYETMLKLYSIPGNQNRPSAKDAFLKDKTLAMWPMYADVPTWVQDLNAKGETFHWDMAQMPSFPDKPNVAWQVDSHNLHISASSKNKDAAFQVIAYLLSRDCQLELVKNGLLPALNDPELPRHFGESTEVFKGKHREAIFKSRPAPKYIMSAYDSIVSGEFTKAFKSVEAGDQDINTALRAANEAANLRIREKKAGQ
jgi:multiple sugar transport system substrate-binding protein